MMTSPDHRRDHAAVRIHKKRTSATRHPTVAHDVQCRCGGKSTRFGLRVWVLEGAPSLSRFLRQGGDSDLDFDRRGAPCLAYFARRGDFDPPHHLSRRETMADLLRLGGWRASVPAVSASAPPLACRSRRWLRRGLLLHRRLLRRLIIVHHNLFRRSHRRNRRLRRLQLRTQPHNFRFLRCRQILDPLRQLLPRILKTAQIVRERLQIVFRSECPHVLHHAHDTSNNASRLR